MQDKLDLVGLDQKLTQRGQHAAGRALMPDLRVTGVAQHHRLIGAPDQIVLCLLIEQGNRQALHPRPGAEIQDPVDGLVAQAPADNWALVAVFDHLHPHDIRPGDGLAQATADAHPVFGYPVEALLWRDGLVHGGKAFRIVWCAQP